MPLSTNINRYGDIREVLDVAVERPLVRYKLATWKAAIRWRLRAYQFRALFIKERCESVIIPGYSPTTPYDDLVLTIAKDSNIVTITHQQSEGVILDETGEVIEPAPAASDEDEMLEAARLLVERRGQDS